MNFTWTLCWTIQKTMAIETKDNRDWCEPRNGFKKKKYGEDAAVLVRLNWQCKNVQIKQNKKQKMQKEKLLCRCNSERYTSWCNRLSRLDWIIYAQECKIIWVKKALIAKLRERESERDDIHLIVHPYRWEYSFSIKTTQKCSLFCIVGISVVWGPTQLNNIESIYTLWALLRTAIITRWMGQLIR